MSSYWKDLYFLRKKRKRRKNSKRYKKSEKDRESKSSGGVTIKNLRSMSYRSYLKGAHWKKTAKRRRALAGWKCEECGATRCVLEVHHLTYARRGRERMGDLQVLCSVCHHEVHRKDRLSN